MPIRVVELVFFLSLIAVWYVYAGYPLIVLIISMFRNRPVNKAAFEPSVSILIAAYNEADCIGATIENKLRWTTRRRSLR